MKKILRKIWNSIKFPLHLYYDTWGSPTLINLTNLTRESRCLSASGFFFSPQAPLQPLSGSILAASDH